MNELISRQAALAEIDKTRKELLALGMYGAEHILVHYGRRVIEELPTADLDEIIAAHEQIGYDKGFQDGYAQAIEDEEDWR